MASSEDGFLMLNRWQESNASVDLFEVFDTPNAGGFAGVGTHARVFLVFPEQGIVILSEDGSDKKIAHEWKDARFSFCLEKGDFPLARASETFGIGYTAFLDVLLPSGKRFCVAERTE